VFSKCTILCCCSSCLSPRCDFAAGPDCGSEKERWQERVAFLAGDVFTKDTSVPGAAGFLIFLTNSSTLLLSTSGKKKFSLHLSLKLRASGWVTSRDHSGRLLELDIALAKSAFLRSLGFPQNLGTCNSADSSF